MSVPIFRHRYTAAGLDEAVAFIDGAYGRSRCWGAGTAAAAMTVTSLTAGPLSLDRIVSSGVRARMVTELDEDFRVATYLSGRIGYGLPGGEHLEAEAGTSVLLPAGSIEIDWHDCEVLLLQLPAADLLDGAAAVVDLDPGVPLRFTGASPVSAQAAQRWRAITAMTWLELTAADSSLVDPLVHREMFDLLAAAAVATFPNTAMTTGYVPSPGRVGPAALRRAVAFIEANASLPITIPDIAGAAGTTARAIRQAFRHHLDTTPSGYLRRVRLAAAHADLQTADPTRTDLASVAARWGFRDPRRFLAAYREAYGRSARGGAD